MDDDSSSPGIPRVLLSTLVIIGCAALALVTGAPWAQTPEPAQPAQHPSYVPDHLWTHVAENFSFGAALSLLILLGMSAFFSGSEVAFFSIHRVRLRAIAVEPGITGKLVAALMRHPSRLLSTILVGNMLVNVLVSVLLPRRLERVLIDAFAIAPILASVLTVLIATIVLVFFGEISPKVFAVRIAEPFARAAVLPMSGIDWVLAPLRWAAMRFTELLFRVTRFNDIQPAPFMTDEEIISVLTDSEAQGVIEQAEGQMIQAILQSGDAYLREILVPRPEVVAVEREATVWQALSLFRQHAFSRMPVYQEDIDHITGILVAKDLLPYVVRGETERPIGPIARRASFVPEIMTIREFIKYSQRKHMHMSVVVDEYGGTEGLVTLDDAIEEVVGEIRDAAKGPNKRYKRLAKGSYLLDGGMPLDELSELLGVDLKSDEHETIAGFVIDQLGKIPEKGDRIDHAGVAFTVEDVDGKRATSLRADLRRTRQEQTA